MATLRATAQYDDFVGTAAADNIDDNALFSYAIDQGIYDQDAEHLAGVDLYLGEDGFFTVSLLIQNKDTADIREVDLNLSLDEVLTHFKRLNIVLVKKNIDIDADYPNVSD